MMRGVLESIGKKLGEISLVYVYTAMGVLFAGGVFLFVDVRESNSIPDLVYDPKTWIALIVGTVIFIVLGIGLQSLFSLTGRGLIFLSSWYPNWYYFPKVQFAPKLTPENDIELAFSNPRRRQWFSLQAAYARLDSEVKSLPNLASGVAPLTKRMIFPLADMPGGSERKRNVGKVEDGNVYLAMGRDSEETMELSEPGVYTYWINISGKFRGRDYQGGTRFRMIIRQNNEVVVRE